MSFKKQLEKDIENTFINTSEFAEIHSINGKPIECVVDCIENDETSQYKEGIKEKARSICLQASLLNVIPKVGDSIQFDEDLAMVYKVSELQGMLYLDISQSIGKFDKSIQLYKAAIIDHGGWEEVVLGDMFAECNAYIRHQSGAELFKMNTVLEQSQTLFKIPYVEGIEKSMILVYKGKHYDIKHIDNIEEADVFIDLICEKVE